MIRKMILAVLAVAYTGCAGSVNGTVAGVQLAVQDAIFAVLKDNSGKSTAAIVVMADKPKLCDSLKANREPKNATSIFFLLGRRSASDILAPDVGDYTVRDGFPEGNTANATFSRTDSNCTNTIANDAADGKSGLVKLTNLKGEANGTANGTFDITFGGGGDKVTGSFNATYCDVTTLQINPNCE